MKKRRLSFVLFIVTALLIHAGSAPCAVSKAESIMVISDSHLTGALENHQTMLDAVIQAARGKDTVLLLGDNTNNSHEEEHALALQWAREIKRKTAAEVLIIPGNHDYTRRMGVEEFSAQYHAYGWDQSFSRDETTASYAVMTNHGTCLLMLDTNQFDKTGSVQPDGGMSGNTFKWLQGVLEALPDGTPVIACGHHPILPMERNERTPGALAMSQIFRAYGVSLYLCGHDHGFAAVEQEGLRQITVGQPQSYPGWVGMIEKENDVFSWHTEQIFDPRSSAYAALRDDAYALGCGMARGTLATTPYADDEAAIQWFADAFMLYMSGEMTPEKNAALLADENCQKWRESKTRTVVKEWILDLLENCPDNIRRMTIPKSLKHPLWISGR